jgi:maltose O-acetyltransferase
MMHCLNPHVHIEIFIMRNLVYLINNRLKPKPFTYFWFKGWAKRAVNFSGLCGILWRNHSFSRKGVRLGHLSVIGNIELNGKGSNLVLGNECFISGKVHLALYEKITLGNNVVINQGCTLLTASHDINCPNWQHKKAPIVIEDYAWIATNSIILPGVTVGRGAVVGAGSVVTKSIPPYHVVAGNPAKTINERTLKELSHATVHWLAPFEAWLGIPKNELK